MILVQHEEETIREIAFSMLVSADYECRGATSPREAWDILNSPEARVVIGADRKTEKEK